MYSWHLCFWCLEDVALQVLVVFKLFKPSWQHLLVPRYLQCLRTIRPPVDFFPVEFATPVAVAVLGLEPLQLHRP